MEISQEEYLKLKEKAEKYDALRYSPLKDYTKPFAGLVHTLPIYCIRATDPRSVNLSLKYKTGNSDAWNHFTSLAKILHSSDWYYQEEMGSKAYPYSHYWSLQGTNTAPRTQRELTSEQVKISVQMLDDLIEIYNKYFMQVHKGLWQIDLTGAKDFILVESEGVENEF